MTDWNEHEDAIDDAISDSIDMDWTSRTGAKAVVAWLNDNAPQTRQSPPIVPERGAPLTAETVGLLQPGDWLLLTLDDKRSAVVFDRLWKSTRGSAGVRHKGGSQFPHHYAFLGRPDADGWIAHDGGENPSPGLDVEVRVRGYAAYDLARAATSDEYNWFEIIAWRPHVAAAPAREPEGGAVFGRDQSTLAQLTRTLEMCERGGGHQPEMVSVHTSTFRDLLAALTPKEAPASEGAN